MIKIQRLKSQLHFVDCDTESNLAIEIRSYLFFHYL